MFGKTGVHGSEMTGLKYIDPKTGSIMLPDESVVFSWNPKASAFGREPGDVYNAAGNYSVKNRGYSYTYDPMKYNEQAGSVYIVKQPRSSIRFAKPPGLYDDNLPPQEHIMISDKPAKVVAEVPFRGLNNPSSIQEFAEQLMQKGHVLPFGRPQYLGNINAAKGYIRNLIRPEIYNGPV